MSYHEVIEAQGKLSSKFIAFYVSPSRTIMHNNDAVNSRALDRRRLCLQQNFRAPALAPQPTYTFLDPHFRRPCNFILPPTSGRLVEFKLPGHPRAIKYGAPSSTTATMHSSSLLSSKKTGSSVSPIIGVSKIPSSAVNFAAGLQKPWLSGQRRSVKYVPTKPSCTLELLT